MCLSVIIPCYNELATIDAFNEVPYQDTEVIVIGDCSTNGPREKLQHEIEKSNRVSKVS